MFDIGFTQLLLIGVVALVVLGPERLPRVARTIGHLLGRAQRYVGDVKSDIQREMELDQIKNLKTEMEDAAKSVKESVKQASDTVRNPLEEARQALKETTDSVESAVKAAQSEFDELSKSTQKELDELTESAQEEFDSLTDSLQSEAKLANEQASSAPHTNAGARSGSHVESDKPTPDTDSDDKPQQAASTTDTGEKADPAAPVQQGLSDVELADRRLSQAAALSGDDKAIDSTPSPSSDHDQKPGTPL